MQGTILKKSGAPLVVCFVSVQWELTIFVEQKLTLSIFC